MSGGRSEDRAAAAQPEPRLAEVVATEGPSARETVRLSNVYATHWTWTGGETSRSLTDALKLGRLARFYDAAATQLPWVLVQERIGADVMWPERESPVGAIVRGTGWLFGMPSGQVVAALSMDVALGFPDTINLLEDGYYATISIDGQPLDEFLWSLGGGNLSGETGKGGLLTERHQIAFASVDNSRPIPGDHLVQQVIYRSRLQYRREFSSITYPAELNRRPTAVGAVGPYVSVVAGHQDSLENAVFLSAVQTVAASAKLHEIRDEAYRAVRTFRQTQDWTASTEDRRRRLGRLAESLSDLELELSFSVEAVSDFGMLVPSLRAEGYHDALYACMSLNERADTVARMLVRLERSIAAEATSVESLERRADERRRLRWTAAVGFLTTVAAPLGLLFAFFGVNALEVDEGLSMLAPRYLWVYASLVVLVLSGVALFIVLRVRQRRELDAEVVNGRHSPVNSHARLSALVASSSEEG